MAIKLATLETPGKQQEWPKPMFYSISSYFGIIVLTAINRAHERSRQSTGQACCTLNWQHQSRSQFSCFPSFLTSSTPITAVLTRPDQYYPVQLTGLYWCPVPFSPCSFRAPWYNFPCPDKPLLRTHNLRFSVTPPPRTRTELMSQNPQANTQAAPFQFLRKLPENAG